MKTFRFMPFILIVAVVSFIGIPAWGQYGLDHNLQQSTSQINPSSPLIDYGARNGLITGNVSGNRQFRGKVGYGDTTDFRGRTGTDSLYKFRASSARRPTMRNMLAPQTLSRGSRAAILGNIRSFGTGSRNPIPSTEIPIDAYRTGKVSSFGSLLRSSDSRINGAPSNVPGRSSGSGTLLLSGQSLNLRARQQGGGRISSVVSLKPLKISGWSGSAPASTPSGNVPANRINPADHLAYPKSTAMGFDGQSLLKNQSNNQLSPQAANLPQIPLDKRVQQLQARQTSRQGSVSMRVGEDVYMKLNRAEENRQRIAQGLEPQPDGPDPNNQLAKPFPKQGLAAEGTSDATGTFTSSAQMPRQTAVHDQASQSQALSPINSFAQILQNVEAPTVEDRAAHGISSHTSPSLTTAMPQTAHQRQVAQRQAREQLTRSLLNARGIESQPPTATAVISSAAPAMPVSPTERQAATVRTLTTAIASQQKTVVPAIPRKPTGGLFASARSVTVPQRSTYVKAPSLPTARSQADVQRQWHTNRMFQQAVNDLQHGRYFDAERKFQSTLLADPNSDHANRGLIHAQIGAGLIRVASLNLRSYFEKFPQKISFRVEKTWLPKKSRLTWIRQQAQNLMRQFHNYDAAILMAYIGYQTGNLQQLKNGLDLASQQLSNDPLIPQLRKAWLGQ